MEVVIGIRMATSVNLDDNQKSFSKLDELGGVPGQASKMISLRTGTSKNQ